MSTCEKGFGSLTFNLIMNFVNSALEGSTFRIAKEDGKVKIDGI